MAIYVQDLFPTYNSAGIEILRHSRVSRELELEHGLSAAAAAAVVELHCVGRQQQQRQDWLCFGV